MASSFQALATLDEDDIEAGLNDALAQGTGALKDAVEEVGTEFMGGGVEDNTMSYEQRVRLTEWKQFAENGLEIHRLAKAYFQFMYFWFSALPTMVLSGLVTIISSGVSDTFPYKANVLSSLGGITGILTAVSAYWKWQAESERHRFASHEYDSLKQRIDLATLKIEMGKASFSSVMDDIEKSIAEIKKQCGPPPRSIELRVKKDRLMADYKAAKDMGKLAEQFDFSWVSCVKGLFRTCCMVCCFCCSTPKWLKPDVAEGDAGTSTHKRILAQQIDKVGKQKGTADLESFWDSYWQTFRMFSEKNDSKCCLSLLQEVPSSLTLAKCKLDLNGRSPLHHAVVYQVVEVGMALLCLPHDKDRKLKNIPNGLCLWRDNQKKIPWEHVKLSHFRPGVQQFAVRLFVHTFYSVCQAGNSCEITPVNMLEKLQPFLIEKGSKIVAGGFIDREGNTLLHIAAEFDQRGACSKLMNKPFNLTLDTKNSESTTPIELAFHLGKTNSFDELFKRLAQNWKCTHQGCGMRSKKNEKCYDWSQGGAEALEDCFNSAPKSPLVLQYYYKLVEGKHCAITHWLGHCVENGAGASVTTLVRKCSWMHYATLFAHKRLLVSLLSSGMDAPVTGEKRGGMTPFDLAMQRVSPQLASLDSSVAVTCQEVVFEILEHVAKTPEKFPNFAATLLRRNKHTGTSVTRFNGTALEWAAFKGWWKQCEQILTVRQKLCEPLGLSKCPTGQGAKEGGTIAMSSADARSNLEAIPENPEDGSALYWGVDHRDGNILRVLFEFALLDGRTTLGEVLEELYACVNASDFEYDEGDFASVLANMWFDWQTEWPAWLKERMRFKFPVDPEDKKKFSTFYGAYAFGAPAAQAGSGKVYAEFTCEGEYQDFIHCGWADERYLEETIDKFPFAPGAWATDDYSDCFAGSTQNVPGQDGVSFDSGDVIGMAADMDNGVLYFSKNGKWGSNQADEMNNTGWQIGVGRKLFPVVACLGKDMKLNLTGPFVHDTKGYPPVAGDPAKAQIEFVGVGTRACAKHVHAGHYGKVSLFHLAALAGPVSLSFKLESLGAEYRPLCNDTPDDFTAQWIHETAMIKTPIDFFPDTRQDVQRAAMCIIGLKHCLRQVREGKLDDQKAQNMLEHLLNPSQALTGPQSTIQVLLGNRDCLGMDTKEFFGKHRTVFHLAIDAGKTNLVELLLESQQVEVDLQAFGDLALRQDDHKRTILHWAAACGMERPCRIIVNNVDCLSTEKKSELLAIRDSSGKTACEAVVPLKQEGVDIREDLKRFLMDPSSAAVRQFEMECKSAKEAAEWQDQVDVEGILDCLPPELHESLFQARLHDKKLMVAGNTPLHLAVQMGLLATSIKLMAAAEGACPAVTLQKLLDLRNDAGVSVGNMLAQENDTVLTNENVKKLMIKNMDGETSDHFVKLFQHSFPSVLEGEVQAMAEDDDFEVASSPSIDMLNAFDSLPPIRLKAVLETRDLAWNEFPTIKSALEMEFSGDGCNSAAFTPLELACSLRLLHVADKIIKLYRRHRPSKVKMTAYCKHALAMADKVCTPRQCLFLRQLSTGVIVDKDPATVPPSALAGDWRTSTGTFIKHGGEMSIHTASLSPQDATCPILLGESCIAISGRHKLKEYLAITNRSWRTTGGHFLTITAPGLVARGTDKRYFEVYVDHAKSFKIGWASPEFSCSCDEHCGTGDDRCSWAVDGTSHTAWHGGDSKEWRRWTAGQTISCAIDMSGSSEKLYFAVDGDWGDMDKPVFEFNSSALFPSFTGQDIEAELHCLQSEMKFKPPSEDYLPLGDCILEVLKSPEPRFEPVLRRPGQWMAKFDGLSLVEAKPNQLTWVGKFERDVWQRVTGDSNSKFGSPLRTLGVLAVPPSVSASPTTSSTSMSSPERSPEAKAKKAPRAKWRQAKNVTEMM